MVEPHILELPTPRLLTYYKKYYRRDNPYKDQDWLSEEVRKANRAVAKEWEADRVIIKTELNTREHVEK